MRKILFSLFLFSLFCKSFAYAGGIPDYKDQLRYVPKKQSKRDRFSIGILAGMNVGKIEHIHRDAEPSSGAFFLVTQPNKPTSYVAEVSGFYNLQDYPISFGLVYSLFGKNKYKATPTFIEAGGLPVNPGYTQEITAHNLSLNLRYNMKEINNFKPFIGVGVGFAHYKAKLKLRIVSSGKETIEAKNNKGNVFTQNVFVGTNYKVNETMSVIGQAKYTHFNKMKNGGNSGDSFKISGVHNLSLAVGLEFKF